MDPERFAIDYDVTRSEARNLFIGQASVNQLPEEFFLAADITLAEKQVPELLQVVPGLVGERVSKMLGRVHPILDGLGSKVIPQPNGHIVNTRNLKQVSAGIDCHQIREVCGAPG